MTQDITNTLILAGAFLLLFALAELLYHKFKVKVEYTRKLVHAGTGLLALLFPLMLGNHWLVLCLCSSFAGILIASLKWKLLPAINAIERRSVGSLAYPLSVYTCYLAYDYYGGRFIFYYLPVMILAVCDPVAALSGRKWPVGSYTMGAGSKTLMGSMMFCTSAAILVASFVMVTGFSGTVSALIGAALLIGVISSVAEAVSPNGWDNLSVPVAVLGGLILSGNMLGL